MGWKDTGNGFGYITDIDAIEQAKHILLPDEYEHFVETTKLMRHFEECIIEGKPSDLYTGDGDLEANLKWCGIGLKISATTFEAYLHDILEGDPVVMRPHSNNRMGKSPANERNGLKGSLSRSTFAGGENHEEATAGKYRVRRRNRFRGL
jgi:hypothetical protein